MPVVDTRVVPIAGGGVPGVLANPFGMRGVIRPVTDDQWPAAAELAARVLAHIHTYAGDDPAVQLAAALDAYRALPREHDVVLGAFEDERLLGMARAVEPGHCWCVGIEDEGPGGDPSDEAILAHRRWLRRHHPAEPHWWLGPVGVEPQAQGRGVGTELLRKLLGTIHGRGGGEIRLEAEPRAVALYERLGFEVVDSDADPDGVVFALMRRRVA